MPKIVIQIVAIGEFGDFFGFVPSLRAFCAVPQGCLIRAPISLVSIPTSTPSHEDRTSHRGRRIVLPTYMSVFDVDLVHSATAEPLLARLALRSERWMMFVPLLVCDPRTWVMWMCRCGCRRWTHVGAFLHSFKWISMWMLSSFPLDLWTYCVPLLMRIATICLCFVAAIVNISLWLFPSYPRAFDSTSSTLELERAWKPPPYLLAHLSLPRQMLSDLHIQPSLSISLSSLVLQLPRL